MHQPENVKELKMLFKNISLGVCPTLLGLKEIYSCFFLNINCWGANNFEPKGFFWGGG